MIRVAWQNFVICINALLCCWFCFDADGALYVA